jgi:hypothetical protein
VKHTASKVFPLLRLGVCPHLWGLKKTLVRGYRQQRGTEHRILIADGGNRMSEDGSLAHPDPGHSKRELVFNTNEVLLECSERLRPERLASSYRYKMGPLRGAVT